MSNVDDPYLVDHNTETWFRGSRTFEVLPSLELTSRNREYLYDF